METNDITYNRASGKIYQGGVPYISKIFRDETEAEDYLSQVGLHIRLSAKQSEFLTPCKTNSSKHKSFALSTQIILPLQNGQFLSIIYRIK
jgi:hypothetical protein